MSDLKQYVKDAIRTESFANPATVNDIHLFKSAVEAFIAAADLLDLFKKNIYYGRHIDASKMDASARRLQDASREISRGQYQPLLNGRIHELDIDSRLLHAIIGIATESGELMSAAQKQMNGAESLDFVNIQEELGDLDWYHAIAVDAMGADWDKILQTNIAKLRARYPEKFTSEAAINRDLKTERKILEEGSTQNEPK